MKNLILYIYIDSEKDGKAVDVKILEKKVKSPLFLSLLQLRSYVYIADSFCVTLFEPPESRFATSSDFSDNEHIGHHTYAIILMKKDISFSPGLYCLNTFFLPVLAPKVVNKITCYHFCLPLKQADVFYMVHMKQKIA